VRPVEPNIATGRSGQTLSPLTLASKRNGYFVLLVAAPVLLDVYGAAPQIHASDDLVVLGRCRRARREDQSRGTDRRKK
jgi:hypothetical protein